MHDIDMYGQGENDPMECPIAGKFFRTTYAPVEMLDSNGDVVHTYDATRDLTRYEQMLGNWDRVRQALDAKGTACESLVRDSRIIADTGREIVITSNNPWHYGVLDTDSYRKEIEDAADFIGWPRFVIVAPPICTPHGAMVVETCDRANNIEIEKSLRKFWDWQDIFCNHQFTRRDCHNHKGPWHVNRNNIAGETPYRSPYRAC